MAQFLEWTPDLSVGIDVIDGQHKRIVDYINQLNEARIRRDRHVIAQVIEELVDYTLSHFSFEESMMEEAHYRFLAPHKRVHELFVRRVGEYQLRFKAGEDVEIVAGDMQNTLVTWLMNHIKREDMDYSEAVRAKLGEDILKPTEAVTTGWLGTTLRRIFGGK
jgi:hemerythrin